MARAGRTTNTGTTKTAVAEKDFVASAVEGEKDHGHADDQVAVAAAETSVVTSEDVLNRLRSAGRDL